jgi:hypothetical protein
MFEIALIVCGVLTLVSYGVFRRTGDGVWFSRANAFLGPIVVVSLLFTAPAGSAILPLGFTLVEWWSRLQNRKSKRVSGLTNAAAVEPV